MKMTLVIDGKSCEYYADITARKGREAYTLKKKIVKALAEAKGMDYPEELLDEMTAFVVKAFDNQFSAQQYMDGYQGWFLDSQTIIDDIMNDVAEALEEGFPKKKKPQTAK